MNLNGTLEVRDMKFHGFHGLHPEERRSGGNFVVSCWFRYPVSSESKLTELGQTIDYQQVFELVSEVMTTPVDLIEELTKKIMDKLLERFTGVSWIRVRVEKHKPPIKGVGLTAFELQSHV